MKKIILIIIIILTINLFFSKQIKTQNLTNINSDKIVNLLKTFNGFVGFEMRSLDGEKIINYNSNKLFIPASITKLFTCFSALESYNKYYTFKTKVYFDEKPTSYYRGNIYIKGFGNPVLTPLKYKYLLNAAISNNSIKKIYGNIIFDYSYYKENGFGKGWMWDDPQPQIAALNIWQENHEAFKYKTDFQLKDYITYLTTSYLQEIGINFYGEVKYDIVPNQLKPVYIHYSPTLNKILKQMLEKSDNQIAEQLFRNLGTINGTGKIDDSIEYEKNLIEKTFKTSNFILKDGCGLSMYNLLSPSLINDLIQYILNKYNSLFYDILATPYEDSTLKNRFNFTVWGKTGTLYSDSAISGILQASSGNRYIFTLIENNFPFHYSKAKEFENKILTTIYKIY
ncbi:D-alanyl-D-alanine carboxypeptidase [Tepiditoga spiralis]|uniref:D-alanyl-D-alanine carboxypeptidase n=1 Tax=Tepiditoga spiralis TaxID=2108365 RepID=A0A7G1GAX0_9BACT|nr:D-alanyl-D-alanine carboxypeptidase [Tepiditoga spiralis]BBE31412.1 D-alanyl-D-alanine carboxypeptidase [Tepiditoga spiralis]